MNMTEYAYFTGSSRIVSMNSYLLTTRHPSRSTLRLFSGKTLPSRAHGYGVPTRVVALVRQLPTAPTQRRPGPRPAPAHSYAPRHAMSPSSYSAHAQSRRSAVSTATQSGPLPRETPASTDSDEPRALPQLPDRTILLGSCPETSGP